MKANLQTRHLWPEMIVWVTCFILLLFINKSNASGIPAVSHTGEKVAVIFKQDTAKNELTIRVKSSTEASMQLFIFSVDGTLIEEVAVCTNKTTIIRGLSRGYYLYECFDKDERMKSGSLLIK